MPPGTELECSSEREQKILLLLLSFLPDILRKAQNADGGWGYHLGSQSSTEPTAWAMLALQSYEATDGSILTSASNWLRQVQTKEGAWPTGSGKDPGCWGTALACLSLLTQSSSAENAVALGVKWLCSTWPAEGNLMWQLRQRWHPKAETIVRQDHSLRGWGWTPNTASWVEPTAYSLLMLRNIPAQARPPEARERIQLGERMLFDRACPGGGWNAGNPLVYGVAGVPRIGPTVWALLALRDHQNRAANVEGIEWLAQNFKHIRSPGSLALAHLCLRVYNRQPAPIETDLCNFYKRNQFLQSIPVTAWATLALAEVPGWLRCSTGDKGTG